MRQFTITTAQSVPVGSAATFSSASCGCITHRDSSGIITLRGGRKYLVQFSGIISGATAGTEVDLSISLLGEPIPQSKMAATPTAANDNASVSTAVVVAVPCGCCYNMSVVNTGTTALSIANANLIVEVLA